jgi:hypothetical protein
MVGSAAYKLAEIGVVTTPAYLHTSLFKDLQPASLNKVVMVLNESFFAGTISAWHP